ncbi:YccF domain-containing protein [Eremococcus coleocola]|uniref:YccF domain-containing protein n=1 Tax=Eremococcus coleocola TaxID=88132 RepID=UPI000403F9D6|nr:YccF domain-containing protein [Eremococcus coleocola]
MTFLGNLIWLVFGGLLSAMAWFFVGCVWCLTIIGIPIGRQCFKIAHLTLAPFGKDIMQSTDSGSLLLNLIWIIFGGAELAVSHLILGLILCMTIIGIPFGKQHFKLAILSLMPIGTRIY